MPTNTPRGRTVLLLAAVGFLLMLVKLAASLLVPLLLGAFMAGALLPLVKLVRRVRLPQPVAVGVAVVLAVALLAGVGALGVLAGAELVEVLARLGRDVMTLRLRAIMWLTAHHLAPFANVLAGMQVSTFINELAAGAVAELPATLSVATIAAIVMLFILLEATSFPRKLQRAFDEPPPMLVAASASVNEVQKYLLAKTWLSALTGVLIGGWCALWGVEGAGALAMIAFAFNFIPFVGSFVAAVPGIILAFVQVGPNGGFAVALGYLFVNVIIGNVLESRVLGRALDLSPLVVLLSVIVWGWLLGMTGAFVGVLLTNVAKIVFAHTADLGWLAVLLGPGQGREEVAYVRGVRRSLMSDPPPRPAESGKDDEAGN